MINKNIILVVLLHGLPTPYNYSVGLLLIIEKTYSFKVMYLILSRNTYTLQRRIPKQEDKLLFYNN